MREVLQESPCESGAAASSARCCASPAATCASVLARSANAVPKRAASGFDPSIHAVCSDDGIAFDVDIHGSASVIDDDPQPTQRILRLID